MRKRCVPVVSSSYLALFVTSALIFTIVLPINALSAQADTAKQSTEQGKPCARPGFEFLEALQREAFEANPDALKELQRGRAAESSIVQTYLRSTNDSPENVKIGVKLAKELEKDARKAPPTCYEDPISYVSTARRLHWISLAARTGKPRLPEAKKFEYGSLPYTEINAFTLRDPASNTTVVVYNYQLEALTNGLSQFAIGSLDLDEENKWVEVVANSVGLAEEPLRPSTFESYINDFASVTERDINSQLSRKAEWIEEGKKMLDSFLNGRLFEITKLPTTDHNTQILSLPLREGMNLFFLAHEYAHVALKHRSATGTWRPVNVADTHSATLAAWSWKQELDADYYAVHLVADAILARTVGPSKLGNYITKDKLGLVLHGGDLLMTYLEMIDETTVGLPGNQASHTPVSLSESQKATLRRFADGKMLTGSEIAELGMYIGGYPPAWLRQERIQKEINEILREQNASPQLRFYDAVAVRAIRGVEEFWTISGTDFIGRGKDAERLHVALSPMVAAPPNGVLRAEELTWPAANIAPTIEARATLVHSFSTPLWKLGGHSGGVSKMTFSLDGKRLATADYGGGARLWNPANGRLICVLSGHTKRVTDLTFSEAGNLLATSSEDGTTKLWSAADGHLVTTLIGHTQGVDQAAFSPDGETIVTISVDRTAKVWNVRNGRASRTLDTGSSELTQVEVSPDSQAVLLGGSNGVSVFDINGSLRWTESKDRDVLHACYSHDGSRIVTAGKGGPATVWNARDGSLLWELSGHSGDVNWAEFSLDDKFIVTASNDKTARIWDAGTGRETVMMSHTSPATMASFSPDGRLIITSSTGNYGAIIWSAKSGQRIATLTQRDLAVTTASFSPDGRLIATAGESVILWSTISGRLLSTIETQQNQAFRSSLAYVNFLPANRGVIIEEANGVVTIWDPTTGQKLSKLSAEGNAGLWEAISGKPALKLPLRQDNWQHLAISDDKKHLAQFLDDDSDKNIIGVWDTDDGRKTTVLDGRFDEQEWFCFSPNGTILLTKSPRSSSVRLWNAKSGKLLHTLSTHTDLVYKASFSHDSKRVVTASGDHTAIVWNVGDGCVLVKLEGHGDAVTSATFSPADNLIVTASHDGSSRLWTASAKLIAVLPSFKQSNGKYLIFRGIEDARFSPDGRFIATLTGDSLIRIWDGMNGNLVTTIECPDGVTSFAFGSDDTIVAADPKGTARVYQLVALTQHP